jgi:hypothetical protein
MAVSPDDARDLAKGMLEVYQQAELRLLDLIGRAVADGVDTPQWQERQLIAVQKLRRQTKQLLVELEVAGSQAAEGAALAGYNRGAGLAGVDLANLGSSAGAAAFGGVDAGAVSSIVAAAQGQISSLGLVIASQQEAIYRDVVAQTGARMLTEGMTRRQASWDALQTWADKGVTGFVDRGGRAWSMTSYAEMIARTAASQAIMQGHVDRLDDAGHDLVMISDAPEECEKCRPWEGKVLSAKGRTRLGHYVTSNGQEYDVTATLATATGAGLFHPNCRHRTVIYLPGITPPLLDTEDPEGDKLRQAQRYKERRIRQLKKRAGLAERVAGKTSPAATKARADLRAGQASFKAWRDEHGRKDLAYRTSIKEPTARIPDPPKPKPTRQARPVPADPIDWNTRELRNASDDQLGGALARAYEADHPNTGRLEAEMDRRDQAPYLEAERQAKRNEAARVKRAGREEEKQGRVNGLIDQGWDPRDAVEEITGVTVEKQLRTELLYRLRSEGTPGKSLDDMIRNRYREEVDRQYLDAEKACRGQMLSREGNAWNTRYADNPQRRIDAAALFRGPEKRARKWASRELLEWWDLNGRPTFDDYRQTLITGGNVVGGRVTSDFLT